MRTLKLAAVIAGSAWAILKLTQWTTLQLLQTATLAMALWFVLMTVREMMRIT